MNSNFEEYTLMRYNNNYIKEKSTFRAKALRRTRIFECTTYTDVVRAII